MHYLQVKPPATRLDRVHVDTTSCFPWVSFKLIPEIGSHAIDAQFTRDHHIRSLYIHSVILNGLNGYRAVGVKVRQLACMEFSLQSESFILETCIYVYIIDICIQ